MDNRNQQDVNGKDGENAPAEHTGPDLVNRESPKAANDGDRFNEAVNKQLDEDAAAARTRKQTPAGKPQDRRQEQPALEDDELTPAKPDNS